MQKNFAKSKTFAAKFEKRFYWAVLDKQLTRGGRIFTRKPGQFRVEVDDGDLLVSDGKAIWAYGSENEQVVVTPSTGDLRTPWEILIEYSEGFAPVAVEEARLEGSASYAITLEPRPGASYLAAGGQVVRMKIWVDKKRWHLLQVEQLEANDDVRTYVLTEHKTNKKLDDALFSFVPPEGVEVIDRRAFVEEPALDD